jgi:UDPglucose 6-dehydrogenase
MPIFEAGLLEMVRRDVESGRLKFTTDVAKAVAQGVI